MTAFFCFLAYVQGKGIRSIDWSQEIPLQLLVQDAELKSDGVQF